jgi:hypothetical protein
MSELNVPASELPLLKSYNDFRNSFHWRVFRIMAELKEFSPITWTL